ncbi:acetyltransferase [Vibrio mimicus]|uniref:Acetyltransferase n=1 Tax=Vibrio mimicus TaxID=674 RepID=A0A2J9VJH6_VIBMI|nr:acetyltransferase [Vibrio mimicus]
MQLLCLSLVVMRCQPLRRALAFKERNLYIPGKS